MMLAHWIIFLLLHGVLMVSVIANGEIVNTHCMQQETNLDFPARKLIPQSIEVFKIPTDRPDLHDLSVSLCPDKNFLKISWKINSSRDALIDLCYRQKSVRNGALLAFKCFRLRLAQSQYPSSVGCWFPMETFAQRPMISVWANSSLDDLKLFYGDLNTSVLDPTNTCGDVCEITPVVISRQIECHEHNSIEYNSEVKILRLSFNTTDLTNCTDESLNISSLHQNRTDYVLNCRHHGVGQMKVLYKVRERICLKYQDVNVICPGTSLLTLTEAKESVTLRPEGESFKTFVIFGVVCIIVITTAVVVLIFAIQRIPSLKRWCFGIELHPAGRLRQERSSLIGTEGVPLHSNNTQQPVRTTSSLSTNPHAPPAEDVIVTLYRRRIDSISSNGSKSNGSSAKVQNFKQLHRSATMALLENTEATYRKKIMILPTPFDSYSRDATNYLKSVFTLDANIPSQCCFDRDIYSQYLTGNRQNWIEQLLSDIDRVLIFLCFTRLKSELSRDNFILEDILGHLLLSKPRPLCKVVFLHVTDSSDHLEISHHGQSFHLSQPGDYSVFISEILSFTGRNPDSFPDLFRNVKTGIASQQFLQYIGISEK